MNFNKYKEIIKKEITDNKTDGARTLYKKAAQILLEWIYEGNTDKKEFLKLCEEIMKAKTSMAPLINIGYRSQIAATDGLDEAKKFLEETIEGFDNIYRDIINKAAFKLKEYSVFATVSYSSTIIELFEILENKILIVPLSHPYNFGERIKKELKSAKVKVYNDMNFFHAAKEAEVFITGADAIKTKSIINGAGTFAAACVANVLNKKFFVIAGPEKFVPPRFEHIITADGIIFDETPRELISYIFS